MSGPKVWRRRSRCEGWGFWRRRSHRLYVPGEIPRSSATSSIVTPFACRALRSFSQMARKIPRRAASIWLSKFTRYWNWCMVLFPPVFRSLLSFFLTVGDIVAEFLPWEHVVLDHVSGYGGLFRRK